VIRGRPDPAHVYTGIDSRCTRLCWTLYELQVSSYNRTLTLLSVPSEHVD